MVVLVFVAIAASAPETTAAAERFSVLVAAGLFRPSGAEIRSLYGSTAVPLSVRASWRFLGPVSIFAGFQTMRFSGTTIVVGPFFEDESYNLRLTQETWRTGIQAEVSAGRWTFRGYGGAESVAYEEVWSGTEISASGRSTGFLAGAAVDFRLVPGLGLAAVLEYDRVTTAGSGPLGSKPELGGIEAGLGLFVKF